MAWTAEVTMKRIVGGLLQVRVRYTDGVHPFDEIYKAKVPGENWIPDAVRSRIAQLDAMDAADIQLGPVTPSDPAPDPAPVDQDEILFRRRMEILRDVKVLIDLGLVPANHPKVVQLGEWIVSKLPDYFDSYASA